MTTRNVRDELLSIAQASPRPGEMAERLHRVLRDPGVLREELQEKSRYVIGLLLLHAKGLEYWPPVRVPAPELRAQGLADVARERRAQAEELRKEAKLLEEALIDEGVLPKDEIRPETLHGLWKGVQIQDEDIEEAKRSLFRTDDDN